jgi:hypothetical protein
VLQIVVLLCPSHPPTHPKNKGSTTRLQTGAVQNVLDPQPGHQCVEGERGPCTTSPPPVCRPLLLCHNGNTIKHPPPNAYHPPPPHTHTHTHTKQTQGCRPGSYKSCSVFSLPTSTLTMNSSKTGHNPTTANCPPFPCHMQTHVPPMPASSHPPNIHHYRYTNTSTLSQTSVSLCTDKASDWGCADCAYSSACTSS